VLGESDEDWGLMDGLFEVGVVNGGVCACMSCGDSGGQKVERA
jgi:hypothetical protein